MEKAFSLLAAIILVSGCVGDVLPKDIRGEGDGSRFTDPGECLKKNGTKMQDLCYANTAPQLKDVSICNKIKDGRYREICYGRVGVATGDKSLCEKIGDKATRQQCLIALEDNKGIL